MVEQQQQQQQARSPVLATLAALSLACQLAIYGLLAFYRCSGEMCGLALLGPYYLFFGTSVLLGIAAWLGATVRAVRRHDGPSALSIGLLPLVALCNAVLVYFHDGVMSEQTYGLLVLEGAWALFQLALVTLLAISVTRRQAIQRVIAVAALVLAVAVLVASTLVDS
jgi:hypothetical protein